MTDSLQESAPNLPDDIEALRALVLATFAERDAMVSERDAAVSEWDILQTQNDRLRHLLLKLTRMRFGARSERLPEEQLQTGSRSPRTGDRQRRGGGGEARSRTS